MSENIQEIKFKELQNKSKTVTEQAIRINAQLEAAQNNFKKLQENAIKKYGTSDIQELRKILKEKEDENEKTLSSFEEELKKIEEDVNLKAKIIQEISNDGE